MTVPIEKHDLVAILFLVAILAALIGLYLWHRNKDSQVDISDLLMENGRLSKMAFTWMGSFVVMSFGFIYAVIQGKLSDTYAALYAATWAVPIVTKLFAIRTQEPPKEPKP